MSDEPRFRPMAVWRRWLGSHSERLAAKFLRRRGYEILARNVRAGRRGEIDLLALDGRTLVVVEVRSGKGRSPGELSLTVDRPKQLSLDLALRAFLRLNAIRPLPVRFDVIAVSWPADGGAPVIQQFLHAFDSPRDAPAW